MTVVDTFGSRVGTLLGIKFLAGLDGSDQVAFIVLAALGYPPLAGD